MFLRNVGAVAAVAVLGTAILGAAEVDHRLLLDREITYELRLERVLRERGRPAMLAVLERDFTQNPRPYVKAWYANYLLYGAAFGLPSFADPARGYKLAKEAKAEGALFGLELVGRALGDGQGAGYRDPQQAMLNLREAAERGRGTAMCELTRYYFSGIGVPPDRAEAERWAFKGAWLGATQGLANLAQWSDDPRYTAKPDHAKAYALGYEAAYFGDPYWRGRIKEAPKDDPIAQKYQTLYRVEGILEGNVARPYQIKAAVKSLDATAADDDWRAQLVLAQVMMPKTSPCYDVRRAREKLERAAKAGVDDARALLADMAWHGIGQDADEAGAVRIWQELEARGNAYALNRIGWLHWWGNGEKYGIAKDAAQAFAYCRRAADLGDWQGQENVADCYLHGIGVETNYYLAAKYYGDLDRRGFIRGREMKNRFLALIKD